MRGQLSYTKELLLFGEEQDLAKRNSSSRTPKAHEGYSCSNANQIKVTDNFRMTP